MRRPLLSRAWRDFTRPRSLAGNAIIRFVGTVTATILMAGTSVLVARSTGADGKGAVATLSYLVALIGALATMGLGDAAIVLMRRRHWSVQRLAASAAWPTLFASIAGGIALLGVSGLLSDIESQANWALPAVTAGVVGFAAQKLLTGITEAMGEIPFATIAFVALAGVTTAFTLLFVTILDLDAAGAVVALVAGPLASAVMLVVFLRHRSVPLLQSPDWSGFRRAVKLGAPMELAQTIQTLSSRADMLVVYLMLGVSSAGFYSVALTVGEVVRYAPAAIAVAAFPAVAGEPSEGAHLLARRVTRTTVAVALLAAGGLALFVPWLVPTLFGAGFSPSVRPALILLVGGIVGSAQWGVCRVTAAAGQPTVPLWSYASSLAVMVVLDLWLIPIWGLAGAAIASGIGPSIGIWVALRRSRGVFQEPPSISWLVPGRAELLAVAELPSRLNSALRGER